nr:hypothetical protein [uncultured Lachnoclostridium sp.]
MKNIQVNMNLRTDEQGLLRGPFASTSQKANVEKEEKEERKSIFAGDTNFMLQNQMGQKKAKAQRDALRRIVEVFESDLKIDQTLKDSALHKEELVEQVKQYDAEIDKLTQAQQELKEEYGITDDSEEEQNLNLIRKSLSDPFSVTEEDMEKLENMGPLTDYQRDSLELDAAKEVWQNLKEDAIDAHKGESGKIQGINMERLKSDPMVGAQKEAQAIKDAARDSIITMLREEAKEKIDEKFGTVTETQGKKDEEEEIDDGDKKKKADAKMQTEDLTAEQKDILERLKRFVKSQGILREDILGLKIDELL